MNLFYHDVGMKGSDSDFPKTVYNRVSLDDVKRLIPDRNGNHEEINTLFPDGHCNAWGVPEGAKSVIKNLSIGDSVLLIRTTGGLGDVPILCVVKFFVKESLPALSEFLWGNSRFPFVFLFDTEIINYTWAELKNDLEYDKKFRPSGNVYRVRLNRLDSFGGVDGFIFKLRCGGGELVEVNTLDNEVAFSEGELLRHETNYFLRNKKLAEIAKLKHGYKCCICGFDFESIYGYVGKEYIECHHLNPLSEGGSGNIITTLNDVSALCANCHRMVHRRRPAYSLDEIKIFMKLV